MSQDINTIVIVGRLVRDGELKYTASGAALCNFAVATNRRVKKGDQWADEASFIDFTLWGKQAEGLSKHLVKGTQVVIQGHLKQERWTDKDGSNKSKLAVHVDDIQLVGGKRDQSEPHQDGDRREDFEEPAF